MKKKLLLGIFSIVFSSSFLHSTTLKNCIYINSYHDGYIWSDTISKEIKKTLNGSCKVIQFNMDSKKNKDPKFIKKKALEAKALIEKINPDIVLTSDDNAAKYLIKPYFKDSKIPFVFCGINWTAKEYDFSNKNITGMIEVNPIKPLYKLAVELSHGKKAFFIGDDTITDRKDLSYFQKFARKDNIILNYELTNDIKSWKEAYIKAQEKHDFIILGHNSAIKNWNEKEIKNFLLNNSKKLVFATYSWMMPYSMIGLLIKAQEQGVWTAQTAKAILNGYPIEDISITTNKTWNTFINKKLIKAANIKLSREVIIKSKIYNMD